MSLFSVQEPEQTWSRTTTLTRPIDLGSQDCQPCRCCKPYGQPFAQNTLGPLIINFLIYVEKLNSTEVPNISTLEAKSYKGLAAQEDGGKVVQKWTRNSGSR